MDYLTAIHLALTVLRYELRVALVVQMVLLWYVDILGRILQRTIQLTKQLLKPVETVTKIYDLLKNFGSGKVVDVGVTTVQSAARQEATHLSKEFHQLPLKLQELEFLAFSTLRHLIIASQGTVYMEQRKSPGKSPVSKLSASAVSKWKSFLGDKSDFDAVSGGRRVSGSDQTKWVPNAKFSSSTNVHCEVNTVNSASSHILPSPKISEAYGEDKISTSAKPSEALIRLPTIQVPLPEKGEEYPARGPDGNAWNFQELKGRWVDRKRSRKEDASDKESLKSLAESNNTQQF